MGTYIIYLTLRATPYQLWQWQSVSSPLAVSEFCLNLLKPSSGRLFCLYAEIFRAALLKMNYNVLVIKSYKRNLRSISRALGNFQAVFAPSNGYFTEKKSLGACEALA